jgi:hypothetical protein
MAVDDSRALARPVRTHGLNLGGRFTGAKSFPEVHCLREKRVRVLWRDPNGRGKTSEGSMLIFDNLARKSASPSNFPLVFRSLSEPSVWRCSSPERTICNRQEKSGNGTECHGPYRGNGAPQGRR